MTSHIIWLLSIKEKQAKKLGKEEIINITVKKNKTRKLYFFP